MKAEIATEIAFSFPNEPGVLAKTTRSFSDAGIGITGMLNFSKGSTTQTFMVLSNGVDKAKDILKEAGVDSIGEGNIVAITLEGEEGAIALMSEKLAEAEVNIENMYVCEAVQGPSRIYVSTNDDDKAADVING
ncbi:MAG: hypothetical protein P1V18_02715 [Candidatus Gracilibacteria bacterium]|nr:hypothetical protein [Candidatus Gracilibacteria bacterium]